MTGTIFQALAILALAFFGILFQARLAEMVPAFTPLVLGLAGGIAAAVAVARGRTEAVLRGRGAVWFGWCAMGLLVLLLVVGRRYRGGVYLPGRINPSEFVKLGLVAFAAGRLAVAEGRPTWRFSLGVGALLALAAAVGDFGLAAQLALTVATMLFAVSWVWGTLAWGGIVFGACTAAVFPMGHLATRFAVWRDPLADATGAGWQTLQSLAAVMRGGATGVGFGLGHADQVPIVMSDFIYAALAEDFGLFGCAVVLGVWGFVLLRALKTARRAAERGQSASALLATGIVASLAVQIVLNIAGVLNALPMTGITLPLISHGGMSLIATLVMGGVLVGLDASFSPLSSVPASGARTRGGRGCAGGKKGTSRSPRPARPCSMSRSRS